MQEKIHSTITKSTITGTEGLNESMEGTSYSRHQPNSSETATKSEDANENTKENDIEQMLTDEEIDAFIQSEQ